jgi:predicted metalloprotease with PDZ domain
MAAAKLLALALIAAANSVGYAHKPQHLSVDYQIRLTPNDTSAFDVEMRIHNPPDTFQLAMAAHPEYDERFWRYVEGPTVFGATPGATISRLDSALWRVTSHGETVVRYRIHLPPPQQGQRAAWRPFISPTGALIGGHPSFMYIVGAERTPSHAKIVIPAGWQIATSLEPTTDSTVFTAPTAEFLLESPILVGNLRNWRFTTNGVPHRVFYWPLPNASQFDTTVLVDAVKRLTQQGIALFGRAPYQEYTFLLQDAAYGALEHPNSVTLGAPSAELATDQSGVMGEIAHEYFHLWNDMRIRPVERAGIDYRAPRETRGLWFGEGVTMFYADLLRRRAQISMLDSTRIAHLRRLIERYLGNSSNSRISPEVSSLAAYRTSPGTLGDNAPGVHLQGELLGAMLDLMIRDATNGRRSLDDVLRLMMARYSGARGYDGHDVENAFAEVCGCEMKTFFDTYVHGSTPIDFDRFLGLIGLRTRVKWTPAANDSGRPLPDYHIFAWMPEGPNRLRILVTDPTSAWARAGLHTGDQLVAVNGTTMNSLSDFRQVLRRMTVGSKLRFETIRDGRSLSTDVVVAGYDRPTVSIESVPSPGEKQQRLLKAWLAGSS